MQPKLCTKCKKNIAVVFITKIENGVTMNEGYCLKCARSLGIPQIDQAVKQMVSFTQNVDFTPQETEQLSQYASDDSYVQRQKEDIQELDRELNAIFQNTQKKIQTKKLLN